MLVSLSMRVDLEYLTGVLDELETLVQDASGVPMNRGRAVVDRSDVLLLVKELRESLPAELQQAKSTHREYESIVSAGREEAERIVQNAHYRAQEFVSETETYRRAQRRADENVEMAERYSHEVSRGSEDYRERVMAKLEAWFEESLESVAGSRRGPEALPKGAPPKEVLPREVPAKEAPSERQRREQLDETQPQEPIIDEEEDSGRGWRASSA